MSRAISLVLLHPLVAAYGVASPTWAADCQAAADLIYADLGQSLGDSLTDGQFSALVDVVYGVSAPQFDAELAYQAFKGSRLQALVIAGNFALATYEFEKWVYGPDPVTGDPTVLPQLVQRRAADRALWLL